MADSGNFISLADNITWDPMLRVILRHFARRCDGCYTSLVPSLTGGKGKLLSQIQSNCLPHSGRAEQRCIYYICCPMSSCFLVSTKTFLLKVLVQGLEWWHRRLSICLAQMFNLQNPYGPPTCQKWFQKAWPGKPLSAPQCDPRIN